MIREKGTDRKKFFRGQVDKYTWIDLGSSYVLTDLLAAFLAAQLEGRAEIQAARRSLWERYDEELAAWVEELGARRPIVLKAVEQPWHMYYLLLPSLDVRTALIAHLRERGILAVFHYLPLRVLRCPYDPIGELDAGPLNGAFERMLDGERRLIERGLSLPVGGSLLLVARAADSRLGVRSYPNVRAPR